MSLEMDNVTPKAEAENVDNTGDLPGISTSENTTTDSGDRGHSEALENTPHKDSNEGEEKATSETVATTNDEPTGLTREKANAAPITHKVAPRKASVRVRKIVPVTVPQENATQNTIPAVKGDITPPPLQRSNYTPRRQMRSEVRSEIRSSPREEVRSEPRYMPSRTNSNPRSRFNRQSYEQRMAQARAEVEAAQVITDPEYNTRPRILMNDLTKKSMPDLRQLAVQYGFPQDDLAPMKKQELIYVVLKSHSDNGGLIFVSGALEIMNDGFGFLRSPQNSYLSGPDDVYVSPSQVRLFNLKTGDTIYGQMRQPKENDRFFALLRIETVNFEDPHVAQTRIPFENLTPLYPDHRLDLETVGSEYSTRVVDLFCPIGKGQRALIVAPPKAGKTILMQKIANAITANNPDVYIIVLLIDERPEEVTEMERSIKAEVISSTFDEQATRHVQVAEMVIEKAKRLVEYKRDVVIFLDSITRLARAYNQTVPTSGKVLSGGVDSNALHKPKRFFGAARNVEEGGSLTIISTALIETGSRMDEVIFEEFKGTGNNEIDLDRKLAERRIFPAINIKKSGTRKEELLLSAETLNKLYVLRKVISPMEDTDVMELILNQMRKSKNNEAFLANMNTEG